MNVFRYTAYPFTSVANWYVACAKKNPFTTGMITTGLKTSAADIFAQKVIEKKETIDWRRNGVFSLFGFLYLGGFQYYLYNHLFTQICGPLRSTFGHIGTSPIKTFLDQAIHHPFVYFPVFYLLKGALDQRPINQTIQNYKNELWENCKALWSVWVPAQLLNFAVVPFYLRIPYVALVSFLWTIILSCMRGSNKQEIEMEMRPLDNKALGAIQYSLAEGK
eukprot:TRINITY_DN1439_c0_g2_i2.p1 TRINITY_DN1439_c0_g2~~TRINITY_DN1439_c0_g2_i2.p1  ORF type:complete len:220 (-),score=22.25 TRINITY_DN1439_c0_g2_i2:249-908(-)